MVRRVLDSQVSRSKMRLLLHFYASGVLAMAAVLAIATARADDAELQKKLSNPVADLITVPFQYTATFDAGPLDGTQHILNIQPVYPSKLGSWNLINRLIVPLLSTPPTSTGDVRANGIGDIVYEGFFSPVGPSPVIWGVGPLVSLNSASKAELGSGHTSIGPALVVLSQRGPWSLGALLTQAWSVSGDERRPAVSQLQLQPIVSYTLDPRHTIGYSGTLVANWHARPSSQVWTVPLGMTYSILTHSPGSIPINYIFGGGCNVARPSGGGDLYLRFQINLIFSKQ